MEKRGSAQGTSHLVLTRLLRAGETKSVTALSKSRMKQYFETDGAVDFVGR